MTPRIAIPVPTSIDLAYNERSWVSYASAVERAGGEAVRVELDQTAAHRRELLAGCHGVCLPGSPADVAPERYGVERIPECGPQDLAREECDWALLEACERDITPLLAICYGVQSLNVWRGGTLVQDLMPLPVNHSAGKSVAVAHTAVVAPESRLGSLMTAEEAPLVEDFLRLPVNTSHHQSVSAPGDGLRVVARCPEDGVVEAVEGDGPWWVVGVQWHPERSYDISAASRALFAKLIAEARLRM